MSEQNSIELVSIVFGAGESRLFALTGEYFEIIDAPNPIDVVLSDFNGAQRARMNQASASFYSKGVQYGVIQITSATAQTVRFAYGSGETGTRRATGSVTISGDVALNAATIAALQTVSLSAGTLAALESVDLNAATITALQTVSLSAGTLAALENVDLNAATLSSLNNPLSHSGAWVDTSTLAVNTPVTVFTPASNTNGVVLLDAHFNDFTSAMSSMCFISKASAPGNAQDGRVILPIDGGQSGADLVFGSLKMPKMIPAGMGLYFISSTVTSAGRGHRSADWKNL